MVERSWTAPFGDPEFWNPKIRGPICFNPPAARTYLPITISRTQLALAGKSETQVRDAINSAFDKRELPALEAGSMSYMLSKQGYLGDQAGHFHPHLMFWAEGTQPESWGAEASGSLIMDKEEIPGRLTIFIIPVGKWSDGTSDSHDLKNDRWSASRTDHATRRKLGLGSRVPEARFWEVHFDVPANCSGPRL
jgi:hypothetical protein